MADIPKLQPGVMNEMSFHTQEWMRQSTDSINARFALVLDNQAANKFYAGPSTGADAVPGFRSLVRADLPTLLPADIPVLVGSAGSFNYHGTFTGTQVTNQVALSITATGMYILGNYVYWSSSGIGAALTLTQKWNDGVAAQTDSTQNVTDGDNHPSKTIQFVRLGTGTNVTFTTTQGTNPTFGTYEVYVSALRIG